jgi:hypothetical protein
LLVVFGSAFDDQPKILVERFREVGRTVSLITPRDLSRRGWTLRIGNLAETTAAVESGIVRGNEIEGIVMALPWVAPYDLPHVIEADRDYVAEEMTAFLLAWLHELGRPVLDRPTPMSLAGCGRSNFEWAHFARSLGIDADPRWSESTIAVTVVRGCAVGDVPLAHARAAEAVSMAAQRSLVTLRFAKKDAVTLVGADSRPEVGTKLVATRLLEVFGS